MFGRITSARARLPRYSANRLVNDLYWALLDRGPDPEGRRWQVAQLLDHGLSPEDLAHGIAHSGEYFETWLRGGDLPQLAAVAWPGSRLRTGEPAVHLLHIMKTGGTALVAGLRKAAGDRFCLSQVFLDHLVALPRLLVDSAALVSGHFGLEALELLPGDRVSATVIRQPLERVLSHYSHVRVDPALAAETAGLSLEEFVHSPRWRPYVENFQSRSLVQRVGLDGAWRSYSPEERLSELPPGRRPARAPLPLQSLYELGPMDLDGEQLGRAALAGLEEIQHVGTTEDLDALHACLAAVWGVRDPPRLPRDNVGVERVAASSVPPSLRRAIEEANDSDFALYEQACRRQPAAPHAASAGPPEPPQPRPQPERVPPRRPRASVKTVPPGLSAATAAGLVGVIGVVDTLSSGVVLIGALVVPPCLALLSGRWQVTALVSALAVVVGVALGVPDGIWGTATQALLVSAVALVGLSSTAVARRMSPAG